MRQQHPNTIARAISDALCGRWGMVGGCSPHFRPFCTFLHVGSKNRDVRRRLLAMVVVGGYRFQFSPSFMFHHVGVKNEGNGHKGTGWIYIKSGSLNALKAFSYRYLWAETPSCIRRRCGVPNPRCLPFVLGTIRFCYRARGQGATTSCSIRLVGALSGKNAKDGGVLIAQRARESCGCISARPPFGFASDRRLHD
ncbi:hypothetical protein GA0061098_10745 [Bradyrhizobium shewense]|uniref:Uncharacterized protein n=1 Tax=Bradyrhizobium shewense TaxID=1761772 RepID=A0A1C3XV26_9BRAD|nr:hypothetical protein GA0061098_10745 [Bradyrhizobium shewense]